MKMNTTEKASRIIFESRIAKRVIRSALDPEFQFGGISVSEVVAKHIRQRFSGSSRTSGMAAGIFGKRRCLEVWLPLAIQETIDHRFRPNGIMPELFIPALNERIKQRN